MKKITAKLLNNLQRKALFCTFNFSSDDTILMTDYFDYSIRLIKLAISAKDHYFMVIIGTDKLLKTADDSIFHSITTAIELISDFIRKHPFQAIRYKRGCYQLLDPNGFDYVGEYVTKKDAWRTSRQNCVFLE